MAESTTTPPEPEKHEPTLAEVNAIALEAAKVAAEAKTKAEAAANVETTVKTEAEKANIELSDEDCKKIANATIEGLAARGAFEENEPEPPAPTPPTPEGGKSEEQVTATAETPATPETPPRKLTLSERFAGRK